MHMLSSMSDWTAVGAADIARRKSAQRIPKTMKIRRWNCNQQTVLGESTVQFNCRKLDAACGSGMWKVGRAGTASRQRNLVSGIYFKYSPANMKKVPEIFFFMGTKELFSSWNEERSDCCVVEVRIIGVAESHEQSHIPV